jgi:hypothetical protein
MYCTYQDKQASGEEVYEHTSIVVESRGVGSRTVKSGWANPIHLTRTDPYLAAHYHRIARRKGKCRAVMAVAHSLLVIIYHVLKKKVAL